MCSTSRSLKLARDASRKATIKGAAKRYDSGDLEAKLAATSGTKGWSTASTLVPTSLCLQLL